MTSKYLALILLSAFGLIFSGAIALAATQLPADPLPFTPNTYTPGDPRYLEDFVPGGTGSGATNPTLPADYPDVTTMRPTTGGTPSSGFSLQPDCDPALAPNAEPGPNGPPCDINAFIALIKKIINYLFYISIPLAAGFIVYGAFVIIISGGNPAGFQKGKTIIVAAIIGITIMLTANLLVSLVVSVLKGATK